MTTSATTKQKDSNDSHYDRVKMIVSGWASWKKEEHVITVKASSTATQSNK